jgi:hypothetical protein
LVAPVAVVVDPPELDGPEAPAAFPSDPLGVTPAEELAVVSVAAGSMAVDSLELVVDAGSESDTDPCLTVQFARNRAPQRKLISAMCVAFMAAWLRFDRSSLAPAAG